MRRWQLFTLGLILGVVMFLAAGMFNNPFVPPPNCPGCAVLTHPYGSCNEVVRGGWVCP